MENALLISWVFFNSITDVYSLVQFPPQESWHTDWEHWGGLQKRPQTDASLGSYLRLAKIKFAICVYSMLTETLLNEQKLLTIQNSEHKLYMAEKWEMKHTVKQKGGEKSSAFTLCPQSSVLCLYSRISQCIRVSLTSQCCWTNHKHWGPLTIKKLLHFGYKFILFHFEYKSFALLLMTLLDKSVLSKVPEVKLDHYLVTSKRSHFSEGTSKNSFWLTGVNSLCRPWMWRE